MVSGEHLVYGALLAPEQYPPLLPHEEFAHFPPVKFIEPETLSAPKMARAISVFPTQQDRRSQRFHLC